MSAFRTDHPTTPAPSFEPPVINVERCEAYWDGGFVTPLILVDEDEIETDEPICAEQIFTKAPDGWWYKLRYEDGDERSDPTWH